MKIFQAMKRLLAITIILLSIASCTFVNVSRTLNDVESYIMERPDSALAVLESIDRDDLNTARTKAHHALLHAMALDKNFIDVSDDSIAQVAVDYFSKHGPQKYHARSLYYLGLAYYYQEDYNKAILEFTKAEEVAEACDSLYLGFVKVAQAEVYAHTYNPIEEIRCLREALDINSKVSTKYYCDVVKLNIISSLFNQYHHDEEAEQLLHQLLDDETVDDKIRVSAELIQAYITVIYHENPDFSKAVKIYEDVFVGNLSHYITIKNYWAWAYSLNALGRRMESQELIGQLILEPSGTASYWQYMIAKYNGNLKSALSHLEDYIKYNDTEVSDALIQSLALSQRDYYSSQSELSKSRARIARLTSLFILLIAIFSALLACILIRSYVKRQEHQKEKYLLYISEINRQLDEARKEDYPALKKKYLSLYKTRFETIGSLSEQYIQAEGRSDIESLMFKKVVTLIKEIKNDSTNRAKFEAMLDEDLDMIMTNLRKEMPKFSETDYSIFSYLVVGFDATTISRLLDISVNNIYVHKHRIRTRIEERQPEHASQFLEMLA